MKKSLIFSIAFAIISFVGVANVSAASIGSHSMDVTVGEVDKISTDEENQDLQAPETGLFGLAADSTVPIVIATTVPVMAIIVCAFMYIHRKRTK